MDFNFKKQYGQNFLKDKMTIYNIVDSIDCEEDDLVIEIGPGGGALTSVLKETGASILCYEIDKDVKVYLDKLEDNKLKIIYDDFLKRDVMSDIKDYKYNNLFIVGNLPYYITTPIITKIIEENIDAKELVFMVQKEVADRFSSSVGSREYGSITVFLNYFYDIKKLFNVDKVKFKPMPKVDSAVIKFIKKDNLEEVDIKKFSHLVKSAFQFKRKNLRNNLKGYDLDKIEKVLNKNDLSLNDRAENVSYKVFIDIVNNIER